MSASDGPSRRAVLGGLAVMLGSYAIGSQFGGDGPTPKLQGGGGGGGGGGEAMPTSFDYINLGVLTNEPPHSDIPDDKVAVYMRSESGNMNMYAKPWNGEEFLVSTEGGGGGGGVFEDSGNDNADGGDQYQLPQAEDSIDLQSKGDVENAASITTDELNGGVTNQKAVEKIFGERIDSISASGVSTVEFTSGINSDYDRYVIDATGVVPGTDDKNLRLHVSTDGGANWKTGASDYRYGIHQQLGGGSTTSKNDTGTSKIQVTSRQGNASEETAECTVWLDNPADGSAEKLIRLSGTYIGQGGTLISFQGSATYQTAEAYDAVRFKYNSGNINGEFDLYGVMS